MEKYTSAVATFNITTSKCTGILINPCEFEAYCSVWPGTKLSLCSSYLEGFNSKHVKVVKKERHVVVSINLIFVQNNQPDYNTCVHLILSSIVIARLQNVSENEFNNNIMEPDCFVNIKVQGDDFGMVIIPNILTSSYQGTIKRSEMLQLVGHGNVVTHNVFVEEQTNVPFISIHQCKYKVRLKVTATVNVQSKAKMLPGRMIIFTLALKGGSSSSMLLRFKLLSHNLSAQEMRLNTCSNMSQKYQIPLSSNFTVFEVLKNVTTVTYGQILNISMSSEHSKTYNFEKNTV